MKPSLFLEVSDTIKRSICLYSAFLELQNVILWGVYFLADRLSLVFVLALVIQTLGFVEILTAFKIHSLKGSCKYSAPLMWSKAAFNKSAPLQICSLFAYPLLCMGGKHGRKKNGVHKHVNIVCYLVVRRESKRVVCNWSVTMVSIHRCQWPNGPIPG